ncbi:meiosis-specific kinetochore protein isoform X2 [Physeter macrocephalus]|uniref:Meiosis-specific kinetochore protein isoform X2 n=1 Tax=Physeter macrocephalus TaxID=9755 RepID=A0A9W2WTY5_PHYMC|nr:meiosis-specific kinetochore protein isoform X2 [Physeter catodon]
MWSLRVYTRKKRASRRLNLTPAPDLGAPAKVEAPSGPGRKLSAHCLKRSGKTRSLQRITEKSERSRLGGSSSGPLSTQFRGTGEKSLHENSTSEEAQDEKIAPLSESVTHDLQVDSLSNSERVSGLSLQHDISSSLLSYSITDSYTEYKSFEESLSSFPSPELFRGSDYLDWECPMLEENLLCKNSTLLDTSKAVPIEKALQFSNLSAILGTSSEDYQKCHRKVMMTLADQSISPKPKSTSNSESDNASCGVLLAEKNYPSTPQKTKKKFPSNTSEICCIIKASPGTRQVESKAVTVRKKKYSFPKDTPQDIIIKTSGRM